MSKRSIDAATTEENKRRRTKDAILSNGTHSKTKTDSSDCDKEEEKLPNVSECKNNAILVSKHYSSLKNTDTYNRSRSRIFYMRNFHNWIKSVLIVEYGDKRKEETRWSRLRVLDLCCGKGGDLFKWEVVYVAHIICVDLSEKSVQQCQDRYNIMRRIRPKWMFDAEFITADCTKVHLRKKFKDPSLLTDIVSCQFAFHYCFESLPQAECMLKNVSECLKDGGYFIGTVPNAYELVTRWQNCNSDSFGNDIYNIKFFCDKANPPLFGAKYHFQLDGVVNCPEFLVYLPVFRKLAAKFGLRLLLFERFEYFYEKMKHNHKHKELLGKMKAVETYPPWQNDQLLGKNDEDYKHAERYMHTRVNHGKIGTLSKSEWEVVTLYCVFVFQKVKTEPNREEKSKCTT